MRLNLQPGVEAYRLFDDHDLVLHCRPALADVVESAKADPAMLAHADAARAAGVAPDELSSDALRARGLGGLIFAKAIARQVIESWEGVEDPDGSAAPVTADRIDALLDLTPVYEAFTVKFLGRWLLVQSEKNGSALSPTGISEGATSTAKAAPRRARNVRAA